jgi:hypothetical protein
VTVEGILLWIAGVEMPKGDSGKTRQAAAIWHQLAKDIDSNIKTAGPVAADVWAKNSGDGIDAFQKFWTEKFAPYPEDAAAYCKRVGDVCDSYAQVLDDLRFAYTVLAIQTWVNILITIAWGWVTGYAELAAIKIAAWLRCEALKRWVHIMVKIILEAIIDSIAYAVVTQLAQVGTFGLIQLVTGREYNDTMKAAFGFDPYSVGDNLNQAGQTFVANAAFDLAAEPIGAAMKAGPWGGFFKSHPRLGGVGKRIAASNVYTLVNNQYANMFMDGDKQWYPSLNQEGAKVVFHGTRVLKNPGHGPIGHKAAIPPVRPRP